MPALDGLDASKPSSDAGSCPLCGATVSRACLGEARWLDDPARAALDERGAGWREAGGVCPACVQEALLRTLLRHGDNAFHQSVQWTWPLDPETAFGPLPTPLRLHADPRCTGSGVTVALVDAGFFPHADLTRPSNRIRAWADTGREDVRALFFGPNEKPRWPGWATREAAQWHGLMTSASAAGNGWAARGLYRGLASDADLVLVQAREPAGRITNASISRALAWLGRMCEELRLRVVSLSLGGDPPPEGGPDPVHEAVSALVAAGVTVVAAAGNDGIRRLVPPASSPEAITVGGLDDRSGFSHVEWDLWHSNYGESRSHAPKPELVAPSLRVVAPLMPGTDLAREARRLFARRAGRHPTTPDGWPELAADRRDVEARITELKLVHPRYQHVEGTSFAAPIVAGVAACMLEANPGLTPRRVRELLAVAAHPVSGASPERQGAGAVDAGRAVALALADRHGSAADFARSPLVMDDEVVFLLHDHEARRVEVRGSWDGWDAGLAAVSVEPGLWRATLPRPAARFVAYKFVLDGGRWLADPGNPARAADGLGGWNSVVALPG